MGVKYKYFEKKIDFSGYYNASDLYELLADLLDGAGYKELKREEEFVIEDSKQLKKKIDYEKKINSFMKCSMKIKIDFKFKMKDTIEDKKIHDGTAKIEFIGTKEVDYDGDWDETSDKMAFRILLYKFVFKHTIDNEFKKEEKSIDSLIDRLKGYLGVL